MPDEVDLTEFTDDEFDVMITEGLRAAAAALPYYHRETSLLEVALTTELFERPGALSALDKTIQSVLTVHAARSPWIHQKYGTHVQIMCWPRDEELRAALKSEAKRARDKAAADAEA